MPVEPGKKQKKKKEQHVASEGQDLEGTDKKKKKKTVQDPVKENGIDEEVDPAASKKNLKNRLKKEKKKAAKLKKNAEVSEEAAADAEKDERMAEKRKRKAEKRKLKKSKRREEKEINATKKSSDKQQEGGKRRKDESKNESKESDQPAGTKQKGESNSKSKVSEAPSKKGKADTGDMEPETKEPAKKKRKKSASEPDVEVPNAHEATKRIKDPKAVECFLTGLPYNASVDHIKTHFKKVGDCRVTLLEGSKRGTGFLTWQTAVQAVQACAYHGSKLQGRWIGIRLCEVRSRAHPVENAQNAPGTNSDYVWSEYKGGPGQKPKGCLSVILTISKASSDDGPLQEVTEDDIWEFFKDCNVSNINMMKDKDTGACRGMAFADFDEDVMVDKAVQLNGQLLNSRRCVVRFKK
eukprot:gnl/MRDRNA2_/MRDRNA2_30043_c0_seq1.p1 gnl/MRDRNA2_/MRDRNA2_30043_c0~~gnl/MRDRNA2_/MRDRNA2_30043_c0_seq1.p1  ORF type:complete len:409 (+),score=124.33 gnl/MRDRNA2_/MRDRNA2_30043_c0_seq1:66-1292(+)